MSTVIDFPPRDHCNRHQLWDRFERADGSVQWVRWEIRPWHDAAGKLGGIVIFAEDITDIREAEEILLRYRLLADQPGHHPVPAA